MTNGVMTVVNNHAMAVAAATITLPKELELIISEIARSRRGDVRKEVTSAYFNGLKQQQQNYKSEVMRRRAVSSFAPINNFKSSAADGKIRKQVYKPKEYLWPAETHLEVGALVQLPIPRNGHNELAGWKITDYSIARGFVRLACETHKELGNSTISLFQYVFAENKYAAQKNS